MNKTLSTTLTVLAVLILAGGLFFAGNMYGRASGFGPAMMFNRGNGYGMGMINGQGSFGMGMMNGYNNNAVDATPLTIDQAKAAAEKYLTALNNSDLQIAEVMVFDNNAYVVVKEISTGKGAFELLVDPSSQIAYPEHGPNMMWNIKYSDVNHTNMMNGHGGMMNGNQWNNSNTTDVTTEMTVTPEQAIEFAQKYLDTNISGATAAADPIDFYGYYTLDFEKEGKVTGMLSVNGYTGQVFLHTWHGSFIKEAMAE